MAQVFLGENSNSAPPPNVAYAKLTVKEIELALQHDSEFLIQFFLGDSVDLPTPEFHPKLLSLMVHEAIQQLALAVPRAHAKTTLAKLAAVHYLLFSEYSYVLYMSAVLSHSVECVNHIVDLLKCDNFVSTFGECKFYTEQEGKGYYKFRLPNGKLCILKAFSAGQSVRGTNIKGERPQLIICDDLENDENIANKDLFMKLKKWMYGPFKKCINPTKHKWIWIANMIAEQSMLYEICQSKFWYSRIYGALLADGTTLWPELWPIEALKKDFAEYCEAGMADVWFAEMMNMPMAAGNGLITAEDIKYYPELMPGTFTKGFITVDFAISKESWANATALNVHIWDEEREVWQIVETIEEKGLGPIGTFWRIIALGQKWQVGVVGLEAVAWQAAAEEIYAHLCLVNGIEGFVFIPVPARARKTERLLAWCDMLKNGMYALTQGDFTLTYQVLAYRVDKKENVDDAIDSAAQGVYMLTHHLQAIFEHKMDELGLAVPMEIKTLNQISIGV